MDTRSGLLSSGAVKDAVKSETKKFTLKIKKAAPKPTEAGNWKESDAKSTLHHSQRGCTGVEHG
jgi:SAGA-associated factor 73